MRMSVIWLLAIGSLTGVARPAPLVCTDLISLHRGIIPDELAALVRAVVAHPDEDTPRLVLADWLDEHGEPARAEFIRLQIKRRWQRADDLATLGIDARLAQLHKAHVRDWVAPFVIVPKFERGFVDRVDIRPMELLANRDLILDSTIKSVRLYLDADPDTNLSMLWNSRLGVEPRLGIRRTIFGNRVPGQWDGRALDALRMRLLGHSFSAIAAYFGTNLNAARQRVALGALQISQHEFEVLPD